jgi:hypothetical protein
MTRMFVMTNDEKNITNRYFRDLNSQPRIDTIEHEYGKARGDRGTDRGAVAGTLVPADSKASQLKLKLRNRRIRSRMLRGYLLRWIKRMHNDASSSAE